MKKIIAFIVMVSVCFVLVGCNTEHNNLKDLTNYEIHLKYNDKLKNVEASQKVDFINDTNEPLKELKFHLYANAFRKNAKATVVSLANYQKAYPNGKSYGDIKILNVGIDKKETDFNIGGVDENILEVKLNKEVFPNERVVINMDYIVNLANINHRLGYGNNAINLCNFYPILCVYEKGGFVCDLYNANGDPFYSKVANYDVQIEYPKNLKLATSGVQKLLKSNQENNIVNIQAKRVRDFGIVLSSKLVKKTKKINDRIEINYYYYNDEKAEETLKLIEEAMCFFENKIGMYPYSQISVVKTNFVHGGMEYPNIVLISDDVFDYSTYRTVIVHELCHQWWYGLVGNNQFNYGWIDEGLTEFCTTYFFDNYKNYGLTMDKMVASATKSYANFIKVYKDVQGSVDTSMLRKLDEYKTEPEYVYNTYVKGVLMFSAIYDVLGEKNFSRTLKYYFNENIYSIVEPKDMIKCFVKGSKKDIENIFNSFLYGKVEIIAR